MKRITSFFAIPRYSKIQHKPYFALIYLLGAGAMLGLTTNLAKLANGQGISPLPYLVWSLMGAAVILLAYTLPSGRTVKLNRRSVEYFVVAGFLTTAGANLVFFKAVSHLGVNFVSMMIALPPLLTYIAALLLGMERFNWQRAAGVLLALFGVAMLVVKQWAVPSADRVWIVFTFLGPVLLAAGNIYRTRRWPLDASPESLVPGMLVAGSATLLLYAWIFSESLHVDISRMPNLGLIAIQSLVFAAQFLMMFVLQRRGGPVLLSLMGGVSAVIAVPLASWIFGESILPGFLNSALLLAVGIISLLLSQQNRDVGGVRAVSEAVK